MVNQIDLDGGSSWVRPRRGQETITDQAAETKGQVTEEPTPGLEPGTCRLQDLSATYRAVMTDAVPRAFVQVSGQWPCQLLLAGVASSGRCRDILCPIVPTEGRETALHRPPTLRSGGKGERDLGRVRDAAGERLELSKAGLNEPPC